MQFAEFELWIGPLVSTRFELRPGRIWLYEGESSREVSVEAIATWCPEKVLDAVVRRPLDLGLEPLFDRRFRREFLRQHSGAGAASRFRVWPLYGFSHNGWFAVMPHEILCVLLADVLEPADGGMTPGESLKRHGDLVGELIALSEGDPDPEAEASADALDPAALAETFARLDRIPLPDAVRELRAVLEAVRGFDSRPDYGIAVVEVG